MKLDPLFFAKENRLFFLDGTELPVQGSAEVPVESCVPGAEPPGETDRPLLVLVPWSRIGLDEQYDEAMLASLRDWLKLLEEKRRFAVLVPVADRAVDTDGSRESFAAACAHCARRVKDCRSVIGFAVPPQADAGAFMAELSRKHAHYVFFSRDEGLLSRDSSIVRW